MGSHIHIHVHAGGSSISAISPQARHASRQRLPWSKFDQYYSTNSAAAAAAAAAAVTEPAENGANERSDAATDYTACAGGSATSAAAGDFSMHMYRSFCVFMCILCMCVYVRVNKGSDAATD